MKYIKRSTFSFATITIVATLSATTSLAGNSALGAMKQAFEQEAKIEDIGNKFFKISAEGKSLAEDSKEWSCVQDKSTGLYWEVKTEDGGARDYRKTYRWGNLKVSDLAYGEKYDKHKSKEAHPDVFTVNKKRGKVYTDWNSVIKAANEEKLCGLTDWRVPSIFELHSISTYHSTGLGSNAQTWKENGMYFDSYLDPNFFPTIKKNNDGLFYWSSTQIVDNIYYSWGLSFDKGTDNYGYRVYKFPVRLVR